MADDEEDTELTALLDRQEVGRARMTDAEYEVWFAQTKARIAASLADPRPAITSEELDAHLDRVFDELYGKEEDAAA